MKLNKIFFTLKKMRNTIYFRNKSRNIYNTYLVFNNMIFHTIIYSRVSINQTPALCFFHVSGFRNIDMRMGTLI